MKIVASSLNKSGLIILLVIFFFPFCSKAATFAVSSTASTGVGTYRQAIIDANASPGADIIIFTVGGTIMLGSGAPVPAITDTVHIDGTSAPGYATCGVPMITLEGAFAGAVNGIHLLEGATGSTVEALNIRGFQLNGIRLTDADSCVIRSCAIGVNYSGWSATANGENGIRIEGGADYNLIGGSGCEGNLISGNLGAGVSIDGSLYNDIEGNVIGLHINGTSSIPNGSHGVSAVNNSHYTAIGGFTTNERNVISGNGNGTLGNGINLDASVGCTVRGNYIGLDVTGSFGIGNSDDGIALDNCSFTVIGGSAQQDANVIADHNNHAIALSSGSNSCLILGNFCGTDASGTNIISNSGSGLFAIGCQNLTIGGGTPFEKNIFSSSTNGYGMWLISVTNSLIYGNFVGTDKTGTLNMGNAMGGIQFDVGGGNSIIGGAFPNVSNTVAYNSGYGIGVTAFGTNGIKIQRNSIYCNTGEGIDLNGQGNTNIAAPVITSANFNGCSGTAAPNSTIELFYDNLCASTCQGQDFIASVPTDGAGNWSYSAALPASTITATVTDGSDNTSEFAACSTISCNATATTISPTACGSYTSPSGNVWTTSNTYQDIIPNSQGCDSIITINLTVNANSGSTDVVTACESYVWMNGITYIASNNTSTFTLTNAIGCDSVITLDLTILNPSAATDVISTCDSVYTWIDGVTYTASNNTATYTTTNAVGCDSVITLDLTLSALPNVSLQPFVDVCSNSGVINLIGASPSGGNYSGLGVNGTTFDPSLTGVGTVDITYSYTDSSGCTASVVEPITVISATNPTLTEFPPVCNTDASFTLSGGSPSGGTYAGTGVVNNNFDPSAAGAGIHTVVYSYTDANGCTGTAQQSLMVNDCLSLHDLDLIEVKIVPNPAKHHFSILTDQDVTCIALFEISGRLVENFQSDSDSYDVSMLPTGMYIVRFAIDGQHFQERLIIE